jgi:hypothetical protein
MLSAPAAESAKITGNRRTALTLLLGPAILVVLLGAAAIAHDLIKNEAPDAPETASAWIADTVQIWGALAYGTLGRFVAVGLTAVVFGGEYGWNTWKLVVPHRSRLVLLAAKYGATLLFLLLSYLVTVAVYLMLELIGGALLREPVPSSVNWGEFFEAHTASFVATVITTAFTVAVTATIAVLARSTVAAALGGVVLIILEQLVGIRLLGVSETAYRFFPFNNLGNLYNWLFEGGPRRIPIEGGAIADHWTFSLAVVLGVAAALVALTVGAFRRQDLN